MLFVSGASDLSARAIANAKRMCDTHLDGRYDLEVVYVNEDLTASEDRTAPLAYNLLATPTLIRHLPLPVRRVVGNLSQTPAVMRALGIPVG